MKTTLRFVRQL